MARILSIEDDEHLQRLLGHALFQEGYEVHYAWNGEEGFEKTLLLRPDLVILDLMLPRMNGAEYLKKLRETPGLPDIPVIIATAHPDAAGLLGVALEALGAQRFLRKPIDIRELVDSVKQVLTAFPSAVRAATVRVLRKGTVAADAGARAVWIDDHMVSILTEKEFELLKLLIESPGAIPKTELMRSLGYAEGQGDALKQILHRLRHDMGQAGGRRIRTTHHGYELIG